jgi:phage-related baseplate assembly protein
LRARIIEAPKGFSVAGPRSAYVYYGKLADNKVKDISATSEKPMEVEISVLSYDGNGEANAELIEKVYQKLNAEDFRPMGDLISVHSCEIIEFAIDLRVIFKASNVVDKQSIIAEIKSNLQDYVDAEHRIGGVIALSGIYAKSYIDFVEEIIILSPAENIKCSLHQAPYCTDINVEEYGVE